MRETWRRHRFEQLKARVPTSLSTRPDPMPVSTDTPTVLWTLRNGHRRRECSVQHGARASCRACPARRVGSPHGFMLSRHGDAGPLIGTTCTTPPRRRRQGAAMSARLMAEYPSIRPSRHPSRGSRRDSWSATGNFHDTGAPTLSGAAIPSRGIDRFARVPARRAFRASAVLTDHHGVRNPADVPRTPDGLARSAPAGALPRGILMPR